MYRENFDEKMAKTRRLRSSTTRGVCAKLDMDAGGEIPAADQEERFPKPAEDESSHRDAEIQDEEGDDHADDDDVHFRRKRRRTTTLDTVISSEKWKSLSVLNNDVFRLCPKV